MPIALLALACVPPQGGSAPALLLDWRPGIYEESDLGRTIAVAGDVDGDLVPDLIVSRQSRWYSYDNPQIALISGSDGRTIFNWQPASAHLGRLLLGPGDLDQDGIPDVLAASEDTLEAYSGANGALIRTYSTQLLSGAEIDGLVGLGDVDSDSVPDFAYSGSAYDLGSLDSVGIVSAISGATGAPLFSVTGTAASERLGYALARLKDHDGDGCDDVLASVLGTRFVRLYSGRTGSLLREYAGPRSNEIFQAFSLADAGDADRDGSNDLMVGLPYSAFAGTHVPGAALLLSGATGALLQAWEGTGYLERFGWEVGSAGDFDGDGNPDVAVAAIYADAGSLVEAGRVDLFSATNGSPIAHWEGSFSHQRIGQCPASVGDLSGDGLSDLVFGLGNGSSGAKLQIWGQDSWLRASTLGISAAAPSLVVWNLTFPPQAAGSPFRMLLSASGRGPVHFGIDIPLSLDPLLRATARGNYPPPMVPVHMTGTLGPDGAAEAACGFLPGGLGPWIGRRLYAAAVVLHPGTGVPVACSDSLSLRILP